MHKIYINKGKPGKRGLLYDVEYEGEVICRSTLTPLLDACRVLLAKGLAGKIEMWDRSSPFPRMASTVGAGSQITVVERGSGPIFAKWSPRPPAEAIHGDEESAD